MYPYRSEYLCRLWKPWQGVVDGCFRGAEQAGPLTELRRDQIHLALRQTAALRHGAPQLVRLFTTRIDDASKLLPMSVPTSGSLATARTWPADHHGTLRTRHTGVTTVTATVRYHGARSTTSFVIDVR